MTHKMSHNLDLMIKEKNIYFNVFENSDFDSMKIWFALLDKNIDYFIFENI